MTGAVSIKLQGGLCNYLFQISCAYAYSKKNDKELILTMDDSVVIHKHISNYQSSILHNITLIPRMDFNGFRVYNEQGFHYADIPNIDGNVYLMGYFQSEKYFKEYEADIRELFSYPTEYAKTVSEKYKDLLIKNTCAIHCRRGDFAKSPSHHPIQNMNYFMKAVKQMPKDSVFVIFSDDIPWCKSNFPDIPEKFIFIEGNSDHEDLLLMSLCNNFIISNSTFSWFAAWLNNDQDKKVIVPSKWFGDAYAHYNTTDLIPEGWIKI